MKAFQDLFEILDISKKGSIGAEDLLQCLMVRKQFNVVAFKTQNLLISI